MIKSLQTIQKRDGLMLCAGNIAPFVNKFPTDNHLYPLITTKTQDFIAEPDSEDADAEPMED